MKRKWTSMEIFQDYAYYYNLLYADKNYKNEAMQIDSLLKKYGKGIKKIINFGCGTGKHDLELIQLGYECKGIDLSHSMIEIAKENAEKMGYKSKFEEHDIRDYRTCEKFDAVVSLFHVMSYQNQNSDIIKAFLSARTVLEKGGLFLFDAWYGPGVLTNKPSLRVKELEDKRYKLIRIARPQMYDKQNVVDVAYEIFIIDKTDNRIKNIKEVHSMRYFFRPELEFYLEQANFELIDNIDCERLCTTDYHSWTSYFIAKAV